MIKKIIYLFERLSKQHKLIQSFYYNRNYEIGSGNEKHPLLWLEDPMYINITGSNNNIIEADINFSVLLIPNEDTTFVDCQDLAFSTGHNIIEYIKKYKPFGFIIKSGTESALTLQHYYDNNTAGARFSFVLQNANPASICLLDEHFESGVFNCDFNDDYLKYCNDKEEDKVNDFDVTPANNCTTFVDKLPDFTLRTSR
ncbi:MAG: hypothetical protein LBV71_16065 [Prevotella sp.]|jgi:hypothetical protein|nr:hypothetical protein [Prevotella sp.]